VHLARLKALVGEGRAPADVLLEKSAGRADLASAVVELAELRTD
jgi:hypothetical protein